MIDLEERLRDTYRAVADRTEVADSVGELPPGLAPVVPLVAPRRTTGRLLAVAACVLLLAVTAVALSRRSTPVATSSNGDMDGRSRAIPSLVLEGFGLVEWGTNASMGLPGFPGGDYSGSVLRYDGPDGSTYLVVAAADPGVLPVASPERVALASDAIATVQREPDSDRITLAWVQDATLVSIRADRLTLDQVVALADSLWFVTPETFDRSVAKAGFTTTGESWRPAGSPFDLRLSGSAQSGLTLFNRQFGVALGGGRQCAAIPLYDKDGEIDAVLVVGPGATDFRMRAPDGSIRLLNGETIPGMPAASVAVVTVDRDRASWRGAEIPVACTAEQSS